MKTLKEISETLDVVITDVEQDIKNSEGQPFTGKNVATMFGYQGAAICACAKALQRLIDEIEELKE